MSENLKTIRELADEFHVSKQAVRKRLTDEFRANYVETVHSNGVKTLVVTMVIQTLPVIVRKMMMKCMY